MVFVWVFKSKPGFRMENPVFGKQQLKTRFFVCILFF